MKNLIAGVAALAALSFAGSAFADDAFLYKPNDGAPADHMTNSQLVARNVHDSGYTEATSGSTATPGDPMVLPAAVSVQLNLNACCHGRVPDYTLTAN